MTGADEAVIAATMAAELLWWTDAPPTTTLRHGEACGCPCRSRIDGDGSAFLLQLDYVPTGCTPDSGLLDSQLAGHVSVRHDGRSALVDTDPLSAGTLDVRTQLEGWLDASGIHMDGAVRVGPQVAQLDLQVSETTDGIRMDGVVISPSAHTTLEGVLVRRIDVIGPCPRPSDGTFRIAAAREPVRVEPAPDGTAIAYWHDRASEPTDMCAYVPGWYGN